MQHKILLDKLKFYGIDGKFKILIESYLNNRHQKVSLESSNQNKNSSDWARINCGIPQGSILVPLLFLLYINDLPSLVNKQNNIVLYADDASMVITGANRADFNLQVNALFKDVNNWFKNTYLT